MRKDATTQDWGKCIIKFEFHILHQYHYGEHLNETVMMYHHVAPMETGEVHAIFWATHFTRKRNTGGMGSAEVTPG